MFARKTYTPVMAIVGFLGSGKTTLLNHLLKNSSGLKIGVIVNDFGDINIDSMLVARQTDQELELSNGCICCSLEGNSLDDAIGQLAHPGSTIDYIIIEASGLAEPKELLRLLINSKNPHARFDSLVGVIDAETILDVAKKHPAFIEQLELADILILNKCDLVTKKQLEEVMGYLRFINSDVRIIQTEHGKVDARLLLSPDSSNSAVSQQLSLGEEHDHSTHLHHTYSKFSFSESRPIDPLKFEKFVASIPNTVYRMKGFVNFGMKGLGQKFLFQLVGNRHELKLDEWMPGNQPKTELVVIGTGFDEDQIKKSLHALVDENPDDLNNETIMDILKYR